MRTCPKVLVACAAAVLACKPDPNQVAPESTANPPAEAPPAGPALASEPTQANPQVTDAAAPPPQVNPQVTDATAPTDTPTDVEPAPDPAATKPGPAAPAGKEPLPTALSTKIDESCGRDPGVGQPAKAFSLKTPDGKDITQASLRGKVVLLNFWGTWCKPCLKELPEFDRLYRRYRKHGLVVVAIATDTEPEKVQEFATQRKLATRLALGGEPLAQQYDSPNFPFSFVIDAKGTIRGSYRGYRPECAGKLEQDLRAQLELLR